MLEFNDYYSQVTNFLVLVLQVASLHSSLICFFVVNGANIISAILFNVSLKNH